MAKDINVGDRAPDFSLPDQDGRTVTLKELCGKPVVLYFYPKDDTPGCTKEACDFRDANARLRKTGATVLGVSLDGAESHQKFIKKFRLPFSLLSDDAEATISRKYGVYKEKSMYGRTYWGIERSTFVLDESGVITAAFRKVKVDGHVDEVLEALKRDG